MAKSKSRRITRKPSTRTRRHCNIESLEPRIVFSTITVNSLADNTTSDSVMTLAEAVALMNHGGDATAALGHSLTVGEQAQINTTQAFGTNDTIVFDNTIAGGTITLLSTLNISGTMTIDGGADGMTLAGGSTPATFRAMTISGSANVTLDRLTVTKFRNIGSSGGFAGGTGEGGAVYVDSGAELTVDRSTFTDNHAEGGSGSTFGGNSYGGAIASDGVLTVTRSTFTANTAIGGPGSGIFQGFGEGGAVYANGTATFDFVTMSDNSVNDSGSDIAFGVNSGTTLTITNSILGQSSNSQTDVYVQSGTATGSNNLIRNTSETGLGIVSTADPLLNALADNGGPTQTMSLQSGSPAINAAATTGYTTDQRGHDRVVGSAADIGAYELASAPTITSTNHATFTAGQAGSFTFTTSTDGAAPTLGRTGTLPTGVTFTDNGDGTATLTGTPGATTGGQYTLNLTAANGTSPDDTQTFTLTVDQAPAITSANSSTFTAGQAGSFTVTTAGYPNATLIRTSSLPSGVTFTDNGNGTATLSGTPDAASAGVYTLNFNADNGISPDVDQAFTLTVNAPATPPPTTTDTVITAAGGLGGDITVNNPDGTEKFSIENPFPKSSDPRRVASGDVSGDGTGDVIVAAGAGTKAKVFVYDGDNGNQLTEIDPFGNYKGGVFVTTGDVNHDGTDDIIVAAGSRPGSKATIKVYSGVTYALIADVWAFNGAGNVRIAAADLNGDGYADVIATRGAGAAAKVRVFDGHALASNVSTISSEFTAFRGYTGGCFVSTGDIDGDGQTDIIVSQASGTRPWVSVFNGDDNTLQKQFRTTAFNGTTIASHDYDNDGHDDIFAVTKDGKKNAVTVFSGLDDSILGSVDATEHGRLFIA